MKIYLIICILFNLILSCKEPPSNRGKNMFFQTTNDSVIIKQDTIRLNLSKNIDNLVIEYWDSFYANTFIFNITYNSEISFRGKTIFKEEKIINSLTKHNRLIGYINQFYIDKEAEIELKRTKRDYIESTDYPYIKVIGYRGGKEVFTTETQIGEEDYDVVYHPEFLEFYEFLNEMAMANRSSLSRGIDRVEITGLLFDKNFNRNNFKIFLINDKARIFNSYKNKISNIYDINKINLLITYVNQLYIDKNIAGTNVIKEKETDDTAFINIKGYRKGKEIFNKQTLIENKRYNQDFEEFILFLSNMIINE